MRIRTLLGEPLLHFVLLGMVLFGAYHWLTPDTSVTDRIVGRQSDKRLQKAISAFPRQALHAFRLTLPQGTFEAGVPEDMRELIAALR